MVPLDPEANVSMRTRSTEHYFALQARIVAQIGHNEQLSQRLLAQIRADKQLIAHCQLALQGEFSLPNGDAVGPTT